MILLPIALAVAALAAAPEAVDDSDLSGGALWSLSEEEDALEREGRLEGRTLVLPLAPSGPARPGLAGRVTGRLALPEPSGAARPARLARVRFAGAAAWTEVSEDGSFSLPAPPSGRARLRVSLDNARWALQNLEGRGYEWESPAIELAGASAELGDLHPPQGSMGEKPWLIHGTFLEGLDFLAAQAELSWWTAPLRARWPGDGDYYRSELRAVTLTRPEAWDVVLHELGHAVMYGAMRPAAAGGAHRIDECYTPALAWSEGWATYFAGAARLSRADPDARFQNLVPRRAPVRLENVPEGVCAGPANEWRVAAGLWDLFDLHRDGPDEAASTFRVLWDAARSGPTAGVEDFWRLAAPRLGEEERRRGEAALAHNTLLGAGR